MLYIEEQGTNSFSDKKFPPLCQRQSVPAALPVALFPQPGAAFFRPDRYSQGVSRMLPNLLLLLSSGRHKIDHMRASPAWEGPSGNPTSQKRRAKNKRDAVPYPPSLVAGNLFPRHAASDAP